MSNLWINSKATHWTEIAPDVIKIHHVYCVMDGAFIVSDWMKKREAAVKAMDVLLAAKRREAKRIAINSLRRIRYAKRKISCV